MLFHTAGFLLLFLPLYLVALRLTPTGWPRNICLCFFSYLFYSGSNPFFLLLLLFSSCVDYGVGRGLVYYQSPTLRRMLLTLSIVVNLGLLGFYKYGGMLLPLVEPIGKSAGLPLPSAEFFQSIVLPAGISFYTFQSMSYSIDLYFRKIAVERSLLAFLNYVAYLPQLIAGPIERFAHLQPQLKSVVTGDAKPQWKQGFDRLALGILQKLLIADSCGFIVDAMLAQPGAPSFAESWAIAIGFGMQIFYDFSAYSHMAIGISIMIGVRLWDNFKAPYQARNVREFWRRWHITLSTWFRDYVYIPLGGSRGSLLRVCVNLMITFMVSGLWHGAHWSFVVWGALHGGYLVGLVLFERVFPRIAVPKALAVVCTFIVVHYAWVVFRITDLEQVVSVWKAMSGFSGVALGQINVADLIFLGCVVLFTLVSPPASERPPGKQGFWESFLLWVGAWIAIFNSPELVQFIYFQF